jgi:Trypsin-like peptidase domain
MVRLTDIVCLLVLGEDDEVFVGSTFPIHEPHRLYLGAAHSVPEGREDDLRIFLDSGLKATRVTAVEVLADHPDVVVLQAEEGLPPYAKLAAGEAVVWDQIQALGYPERDIRDVEPGKRTADVRGLVGTVSRKVEAGQAPHAVKASAYEVSFAIPNGMSGGPVFLANVGVRLGLIGVCLGNWTAYSTLFEETVETTEGQSATTKESRIIEYGIVANLNRYADGPIGLVGKTLRQLLGSEAGPTVAGWSNEVQPED